MTQPINVYQEAMEWLGADALEDPSEDFNLAVSIIRNLLAELDRVNALRESDEKEPVLVVNKEDISDDCEITFTVNDTHVGTYRRVRREGE